MGKMKKGHELLTFGGRLRYFREKKGLNQQDLAKGLFTVRQNVAAWESNERQNYGIYIDRICKILDVDETYLVTGITKENQTVASELGLNNDSINFLKQLSASKDDQPIPITWTDGWTEDEEKDVTSPDEILGSAEVEAVYPSEILSIVNYLLSDVNGQSLLSMIYKYVTLNPRSAKANTFDISEYEKVLIPVDELLFTSSKSNHVTSISVFAMPYAIKEMICMKLEYIKKKMLEEMED